MNLKMTLLFPLKRVGTFTTANGGIVNNDRATIGSTRKGASRTRTAKSCSAIDNKCLGRTRNGCSDIDNNSGGRTGKAGSDIDNNASGRTFKRSSDIDNNKRGGTANGKTDITNNTRGRTNNSFTAIDNNANGGTFNCNSVIVNNANGITNGITMSSGNRCLASTGNGRCPTSRNGNPFFRVNRSSITVNNISSSIRNGCSINVTNNDADTGTTDNLTTNGRTAIAVTGNITVNCRSATSIVGSSHTTSARKHVMSFNRRGNSICCSISCRGRAIAREGCASSTCGHLIGITSNVSTRSIIIVRRLGGTATRTITATGGRVGIGNSRIGIRTRRAASGSNMRAAAVDLGPGIALGRDASAANTGGIILSNATNAVSTNLDASRRGCVSLGKAANITGINTIRVNGRSFACACSGPSKVGSSNAIGLASAQTGTRNAFIAKLSGGA